MRTLKLGDRGKEVLDVQSRLFSLGYDLGTDGVDGYFGEDTRAAVLHFQQRNGLRADGVIADNTWQELVEARYEPGERLLYLRIPSFRGVDVLHLQRSLNRLGFNAGPEDGILGPGTERAVLDFQKNAGMVMDGMIDESVLKVMARVTKDGEPHAAGAKIPDRNGGYAVDRDLADLTVVVDPGHGGDDDGDVSQEGIREKDVNLEVALGLGKALESIGCGVLLTRDGDVTVPLYDRPALANQGGADLFISIHHNSNPSPRAQGAAAYYFCRHGYFSEPGIILAGHLVTSISEALDVPPLPPLGRNYAVLRETEMTAVLLEPVFITADGMDSLLNESGYATRAAEAILAGLGDYFSPR